jgi:23S rRNA (pseudouridine1915-N3)-methyltransferase
MQLRLIAVDKLRSPPVAELCAELRKRLGPYYPFEEIEVRPGSGKNAPDAMRDECERILRHVRPDDRVWLLERTGSRVSSEALARRLDDVARSGASRLTFVVAGTFGAADALLERAEFRWSLSDLTFLHEWARAIVLEQLYRAAKILRNEPYHH